MSQEEIVRTPVQLFELSKMIGRDEWEEPDQIAGKFTEGQIYPWLIVGALIICCGNIVYAFIELLMSA